MEVLGQVRVSAMSSKAGSSNIGGGGLVARPNWGREFSEVSRKGTFVGILGFLSYVCGVLAENMKPEWGTPVLVEDFVICQYPGSTVPFGIFSCAFLGCTTIAGWQSLFYPYGGRSIPLSALFQSTMIVVFFSFALLNAALAAILLLWSIGVQIHHWSHNVHPDLDNACPTATTNLLGMGALVSLYSALFWLVSLMLTYIARDVLQ